MQDEHETILDSDEGSLQGERTVSYIPKWSQRIDRLRELENYRKQVNDLEVELRGKHCRMDREGSSDDPNYNVRESSRGDGS